LESFGVQKGTVTKAKETMCYTVDVFPFLDLTIKYGGAGKMWTEEKRGALQLEVAAAFPLQLQREIGDPLVMLAGA